MELDRLAVQLRLRNPWEAIDLGFAMVRTWMKEVYAPWFTVFLPVCAIALLLLPPQWATLLVWWLKPALDRVVLHVLAAGVFGELPRLRDTLRALPRALLQSAGMAARAPARPGGASAAPAAAAAGWQPGGVAHHGLHPLRARPRVVGDRALRPAGADRGGRGLRPVPALVRQGLAAHPMAVRHRLFRGGRGAGTGLRRRRVRAVSESPHRARGLGPGSVAAAHRAARADRTASGRSGAGGRHSRRIAAGCPVRGPFVSGAAAGRGG